LYNVLVFSLSFFNFISNSKVKRNNFVFTCLVKYLVKSIEFRLFNKSIKKVLYNNKKNQGFSNNCCIKTGLKDLSIKVFSLFTYLSLIIKLFNLLVHSLLILILSLFNSNIRMLPFNMLCYIPSKASIV
jgi:hypothetical protein